MSKFTEKASRIMQRMINDLDIHLNGAAAVLGNFGVETGGFTLRLEKGKPPLDQGFGWAQWTGYGKEFGQRSDRRLLFENWCRANGYDDVVKDPLDSAETRYDEACYRYFIHEITNTWEKRALTNLRREPDPNKTPEQDIKDRTIRFMKEYERPGVPHEDRRMKMALEAMEAYIMSPVAAATPGTVIKPASAPGTVPANWLVEADMERIIVHWTAGTNKASSEDRKHYHVLVEGDGTVVRGTHSIDDNESTDDQDYAAHTRACNTGSIGVSMCGMHNAISTPFNAGPHPITEKQWDVTMRVIAELARKYRIPVTPKTILSHAEVQPNLGIQQAGKWDITRLPWDPSIVGHKACGDKMRADVVRAMSGTAAEPAVKSTDKKAVGGLGIVGTVIAALVAWLNGIDWSIVLPIAVVIVGVLATLFFRRRNTE